MKASGSKTNNVDKELKYGQVNYSLIDFINVFFRLYNICHFLAIFIYSL